MADQKSFNLIKQEVIRKKVTKKEVNWYMVTTILGLIFLTSLSILLYFFQIYLDKELDNKKQKLFSYVSSNLNTAKREEAIRTISLVNDRHELYREITSQSLDFSEFEKSFSQTFPYARIKKINLERGSEFMMTVIIIPNDAYNNLYKFLKDIKNSSKFDGSKIKNVQFNVAQPTSNSSAEIKMELKYNLESNKNGGQRLPGI